MKFLFSHFGVFEKGGWGRTFSLAEGLVKLGHEVTIVTTNPKYSLLTKRRTQNNVKIIIFPDIISAKITSKGFGFISLILKIIYVLFKNFDIVHSDEGHRPSSGIPCKMHKKIHKSKYVAEWWDWFGEGGQYDTKSRIFKIFFGNYELKYEIKDKLKADGIIVLSEVLKERAVSLSIKKPIIKLHGGANVVEIPYLENNELLKEKYNIDRKLITFGYIDALGQDFDEIRPLMEAISVLKLQSKVKILVFGFNSDFIHKVPLELRDIIVNFGWINYKTDYEKLQCVDVFVLFKEDNLLNRAGWPNCIGDFMACGRSILLNPVGEVKDFSTQHPEGFFLCTSSFDSVIENVKLIIDKPEILKEKGKINRSIAENEISWQIKSEQLLEFYKTILTEK